MENLKMTNPIFIPGNVPSLKNSKIATKRGVFHSKTVQNYLRALGIQHFSSSKKEVKLYKTKPLIFPVDKLKELFKDVEYPVAIGMHFVRKTKAKFDMNNVSQILLDLFTAFDIIPDDNLDYVYSIPYIIDNKLYTVDKDAPGVYLKIIENYIY